MAEPDHQRQYRWIVGEHHLVELQIPENVLNLLLNVHSDAEKGYSASVHVHHRSKELSGGDPSPVFRPSGR